MASDTTLRKLYKQYYKESGERFARWAERGYAYPPPPPIPYPEELRGLACGARTRKGTPCKIRDIYLNGRCKFHGGLSTGPKTAAGKKKSAANWQYRWRKIQTP